MFIQGKIKAQNTPIIKIKVLKRVSKLKLSSDSHLSVSFHNVYSTKGVYLINYNYGSINCNKTAYLI